MLNFNFSDFSTWISLVMFISLWNLGFVAITRKGKIGYFLLEFFERKKKVNVRIEDGFRERVSKILKETYERFHQAWAEKADHPQIKMLLINKIDEILSEEMVIIFTETENLLMAIENGTYTYFDYYCEVDKDVFPDCIKDPLIVCITCLASFHGILLYSAIAYCRHWHWNLFELVTIIIPVAFIGEFLWKLKTAFDKFILSGK